MVSFSLSVFCKINSIHLLCNFFPTAAVRLPRSSGFISPGRLHPRLGHPGVDPRIQWRPAAKISNKVRCQERMLVQEWCLLTDALIEPFVWQIPQGSLSGFSVCRCVSIGGSVLHRHWPAARHHVQLLRQCAQRSGREHVRWRQCSTDHHHCGSV